MPKVLVFSVASLVVLLGIVVSVTTGQKDEREPASVTQSHIVPHGFYVSSKY